MFVSKQGRKHLRMTNRNSHTEDTNLLDCPALKTDTEGNGALQVAPPILWHVLLTGWVNETQRAAHSGSRYSPEEMRRKRTRTG